MAQRGYRRPVGSFLASTRLPRIGEGLVIPRDSRFVDLDGDEGELKVPAGISLLLQDP
jgi:hypothetical protein